MDVLSGFPLNTKIFNRKNNVSIRLLRNNDICMAQIELDRSESANEDDIDVIDIELIFSPCEKPDAMYCVVEGNIIYLYDPKNGDLNYMFLFARQGNSMFIKFVFDIFDETEFYVNTDGVVQYIYKKEKFLPLYNEYQTCDDKHMYMFAGNKQQYVIKYGLSPSGAATLCHIQLISPRNELLLSNQ